MVDDSQLNDRLLTKEKKRKNTSICSVVPSAMKEKAQQASITTSFSGLLMRRARVGRDLEIISKLGLLSLRPRQRLERHQAAVETSEGLL